MPRDGSTKSPAAAGCARTRPSRVARVSDDRAARWEGSAGVDDPDENIVWNRHRWGDDGNVAQAGQPRLPMGGGVAQTPATVAALADKFLRPYVGDRYDLAILEISPGGGRMTAELVRYAKRLSLVDLNEAAIDICRERFGDVADPDRVRRQRRAVARGVGGAPFDLIACYDSMVHMHPDVVRGYVAQMPALLAEGGTAWLDHSGKGQRTSGARTAMTAELMAEFAAEAGTRS